MAGGTVYLVGAGPGDPGLLTLRGAELLGQADVVVYDGLANAALLDHAPARAERIYAGKKHSEEGAPLTQAAIEALLIEHARRGATVVRLKGGDPFVFGRGGEEAEALVAAGVPFEVVPGVSAVSAVPAYAGIPLTHRDAAAQVVFIATGQEEGDRARVDWNAAARADTLALFMAVRTLPEIVAALLAAGKPAATPAAVIRWGTTPQQRTLVAPLAELPAAVAAAHLDPPALVVIGPVVAYRERLAWFERRPLFGLAVLVPRAPDTARPFAAALAALGAEPVVRELTETVPGEDAALERALDALAGPSPAPATPGLSPAPAGTRWLALASARAVDATFAALGRLGRDARALAGVRVGVVGEASAAALAAHGVRADLVATDSTGAGLARALLAADPALGAGGAVLVPRAAEGRPELAETLAAGGARVTAVAAYRTVAVPPAKLAAIVRRLAAGRLPVLTFFAPSQVEALVAAAGAPALARARVVAAVGATTAAALAAHGVRVDVVPTAPAGLAAALVSFLKEAP
jgi:uroporphyrinogen III methyltransferase/synthase